MRHNLGRRVVAVVLSWAVPATSAWAVAPPVVVAAGAPALQLSVGPGLAAALGRAALEAHDNGGDRDDREGRDGRDDRDDRKDRDRGDKDRDKHDRRVRPIFVRCECIEDEGDGTYTAHFGYESQNASAVTIGAGGDNQIVPLPGRRDQPTRFLPGRW